MSSADAKRIAHVTFVIVLLPIDLRKMVKFNPREVDAAISNRFCRNNPTIPFAEIGHERLP